MNENSYCLENNNKIIKEKEKIEKIKFKYSDKE